MVATNRLQLIPLSVEQLFLLIADTYQLEKSLGLPKGHREHDEVVLRIITYFTIPRLKDSTLNPLYHTQWIAIDSDKQKIVAEAKFKGEPDETGTIEIGYGTYPKFRRQGYMTEMVIGMVEWVKTQPDVFRVVADTETENVASQKVLEKAGFRLYDRIENMLWWERLLKE